jgi:chemotaxis protein methyltransferase CheR
MAPNQENEILNTREFEHISRLAFETCGIDLGAGKRELVQARIGKKMRQGRFGSFKEYLRHVEADKTGQELIALLDSLTTNFTSFLREPAHFEFLRNTILPGIRGEIRIWSAACSTGEEPFTIAFSLLEALGNTDAQRIKILASDLSTRVLETAKAATYPADRFTACPPRWLKDYLLRGTGQAEGLCRVKPAVRTLIEFRRWNLMETFNPPQPFHVIFCRNVMIYFDKETQEGVVNRLATCLAPGGYLLVGHAESLTGLRHPYTYVKPAVYRKPL